MSNWCLTLREKCPYSELFWSIFSRTRTEYSVWMRENTDQNNCQYENFLCSVMLIGCRSSWKFAVINHLENHYHFWITGTIDRNKELYLFCIFKYIKWMCEVTASWPYIFVLTSHTRINWNKQNTFAILTPITLKQQ